MKLQDRLPEGVTVDGRFFRLDFDFRNVLRMMEVMARADIMIEARDYLALKCLTKHPRHPDKVLPAVYAVLFEEAPKSEGPKVTDFVQDAGLIRAAFLQSYGIDLYHDRLHWIAFRELLCALPEGSRYRDVVGIRARPIPPPTKAKASVALRMSEEEQQEKYRQDVANIAAVLLAWAGEKNG